MKLKLLVDSSVQQPKYQTSLFLTKKNLAQ